MDDKVVFLATGLAAANQTMFKQDRLMDRAVEEMRTSKKLFEELSDNTDCTSCSKGLADTAKRLGKLLEDIQAFMEVH
jgi:hypothetical protein